MKELKYDGQTIELKGGLEDSYEVIIHRANIKHLISKDKYKELPPYIVISQETLQELVYEEQD